MDTFCVFITIPLYLVIFYYIELLVTRFRLEEHLMCALCKRFFMSLCGNFVKAPICLLSVTVCMKD